jgi:hypothetical protein
MAAAQIPFGLPLTLLDLSVNWCYKKGDGQVGEQSGCLERIPLELKVPAVC